MLKKRFFKYEQSSALGRTNIFFTFFFVNKFNFNQFGIFLFSVLVTAKTKKRMIDVLRISTVEEDRVIIKIISTMTPDIMYSSQDKNVQLSYTRIKFHRQISNSMSKYLHVDVLNFCCNFCKMFRKFKTSTCRYFDMRFEICRHSVRRYTQQ